MAQITITIPTPVATRVLNAVCLVNGWKSEELHGTKISFAKGKLVEWIMNNVKQAEAQVASVAARNAAIQAVIDEIEIT